MYRRFFVIISLYCGQTISTKSILILINIKYYLFVLCILLRSFDKISKSYLNLKNISITNSLTSHVVNPKHFPSSAITHFGPAKRGFPVLRMIRITPRRYRRAKRFAFKRHRSRSNSRRAARERIDVSVKRSRRPAFVDRDE